METTLNRQSGYQVINMNCADSEYYWGVVYNNFFDCEHNKVVCMCQDEVFAHRICSFLNDEHNERSIDVAESNFNLYNE